ncbi:sialic acid-binding Ig-like lectin 14 isoform X1 [Ursus maritimus]|uniref:Sialic acid-binding Ig-like lectin 14 isoform X1 n=2 Tax=Ursus maritimus TaxID=29073 RepID=A0A8M1G280_URSMA|nr:sialic acid-binding Ig-like lectin 14 isoform X1 [Ursus maritimus]
MVPLLLLPLLWGGSLQEDPGYELRVQDLVMVQEGLCVQVPCSFSYPWSSWSPPGMPYMNWFRVGDSSYRRYPVATNDRRKAVKTETQGRFLLVGNSWDNNCSLRIREARRSDQGAYEFQVDTGDYRKYTYEDKRLTLQVTALTQKPDIHFLEPLKSGHPTNLTCSLPGSCEEGRSLAFFSWVGGALDSLDPGTLRSSVLTLIPRPRDHGSNLTCQVQLSGTQGTVERTIRLNVSYAPQLMTTHILQGNCTGPKTMNNGTSLPVLEGQSLRLVCTADSNPPARLSWSREGKALSPSQPSGVLELPHAGVEDEGEFTCQAQHPLGSQHVSFSLSVQRSPSACNCVTEKQEGSWPLILTLIRGALMGAGFLLTYGLGWVYYSRCGGLQGARLRVLTEPPSSSTRDCGVDLKPRGTNWGRHGQLPPGTPQLKPQLYPQEFN